MTTVFWETETTALGGVTIIYYYAYVITQTSAGGNLDDNGSQFGEPAFPHPVRRSYLAETITWRAAYVFYEDDTYHFIMTQTDIANNLLLRDGKQIAFPVNTGPGALATRNEYLISFHSYWCVSTLVDADSYTGYVQNDNVMYEHSLGFFGNSEYAVATQNSFNFQPRGVGYTPARVTRNVDFLALPTKGLLMDPTELATTPIFEGAASAANTILQSNLTYEHTCTVNYDTSGTIPDNILLIHNINGLTGGANLTQPITSTFPDAADANREYGVAHFSYPLGLAGESVTGSTTLKVKGLIGAVSVSSIGRTLTNAVTLSGIYRPPAYNTPTTDNNVIQGGYIP